METKRMYSTPGVLLVVLALIVLVLVACSKDEDSKAGNVNEYLLSLPSWAVFSPTLEDSKTQSDPTIDFSCLDKKVTTSRAASITRTPEEIVTYDPGSEILYLGSLIQGEGYLGGLGSIKALPIYQRAPLTISISFQMENNFRVVENPDLASVRDAIGSMVQAADLAGHVAGSSIFYNETSGYSVEQIALELGLSAKFMKGGIQGELDWEHNTETHTLSAHFVHRMYTVSMQLPQRPGDLFSSDFTQELLDEQISLGNIGPNNLPVYVSNIVYGIIMTMTMTSTYEVTDMYAALEASYNGISGGGGLNYLEILGNSQIKVATIGGNPDNAIALIKSGRLCDYFDHSAELTTAVPISYTLRNVADNDIATVSETASYTIVETDSLQVQFFSNENAWRSAVRSIGMQDGKFLTTAQNMYYANEAGTFTTNPSNGQIFMYNHITFPGTNTGFPFDFYLENTGVTYQDYRALVYHDDTPNFPETSISIGNYNNSSGPLFDDDDFSIGITGNKVYSIGFTLIGNDFKAGEYLQSIGQDECDLGKKDDFKTYTTGFVGVISPVPLTRIEFEEAIGEDDIAVQDFFFGYLPE